MRYAMILAGGSGLRLWPMSRARLPKQLIPLLGGKSLLELAAERLEGLVSPSHRYICAAESQREAILGALPGWAGKQYLGEPVGRDTLNAVGYSAAMIARDDPQATIAVFTADHLIEPAAEFRRFVESAYHMVDADPLTLVTFGIEPAGPATAYGYLELGDALDGEARRVRRFQEKPDLATATRYFEAGPDRYLWNSGMFVWRASTLLDCIRRYEPATHAALLEISGGGSLEAIYPGLKKVSVDYAVMEPASRDAAVRVAAVPMRLRWMDIGSWPSFGQTCDRDESGNAASARFLALDSSNNLVASSDPAHLVALLGCEDLIVIHTADATLVCHKDRAEEIKKLHQLVAERFSGEYL